MAGAVVAELVVAEIVVAGVVVAGVSASWCVVVGCDAVVVGTLVEPGDVVTEELDDAQAAARKAGSNSRIGRLRMASRYGSSSTSCRNADDCVAIHQCLSG